MRSNKWLAAVLGFCISGCSMELKSPSSPSLGLQTGYVTGQSADREFKAASTNVRAAIKINSVFEIDEKYGELETAVEALHQSIFLPERGSLVGVSPFIRYYYPATAFRAYVEAGAGPIYLNIHTTEQGPPGFNFIDQIGAGIEYRPLKTVSLSAGYRFSHISHAGLRDTLNLGLNSHSINFGITFDF